MRSGSRSLSEPLTPSSTPVTLMEMVAVLDISIAVVLRIKVINNNS